MKINVPGYGDITLNHVVCDYNGTIAHSGIVIEGVREKLNQIKKMGLSVSVITADTNKSAARNLEGVDCKLTLLKTNSHRLEKAEYIQSLGAENVIAFGNGNNDSEMLKNAELGIAVLQKEGLNINSFKNADIIVKSILDGLDLLLKPNHLIATLRT